jgi:hypothetical protein
MKYAVKNLKTGRLVKDAITGKILYSDTREQAEKIVESMNAFARMDEKNRSYGVVEARSEPRYTKRPLKDETKPDRWTEGIPHKPFKGPY